MAKRQKKKFTPAELIRALNATPLGEVVTDRKLHRHREAAGEAIGNRSRVDLVQYAAWCLWQKAKTDRAARNAKMDIREAAARKSRQKSEQVRDIGEIPPCADPKRRESCRGSLKRFMETYFAEAFYLEWSPDQLKTIRKMEMAARDGVKYLIIEPRGFGKTTRSVIAALWAMLYSYSEYVVIVAGTSELSESILDGVKTYLEMNPLLAADFPEFSIPIQALEGNSARCNGQMYKGQLTKISYRADRIIFAFLPDYPHTGGVFRVGSLSGKAMRGFQHIKPDLSVIRPKFGLCDDPQTDESAVSFIQTNKREKALQGTILQMAGPDQVLGLVMCATKIAPDDLTHRFLDREKHFDWLSSVTPLVYAWPDKAADPFWEEYEIILRGCYDRAQDDDDQFVDENKLDLSPATDYYRKNRAVMDNGSKVAWAAKFIPSIGEISALQHAFNKKIALGQEIFGPEYMGETSFGGAAGEALTMDELLGKKSDPVEFPGRISDRYKRGEVPPEFDHLVAFVDVHKKLLYWKVCAVRSEGFGLHVVDYGAYPDPRKTEFTLSSAKVGMMNIHRGGGEEAAILAGLKLLIDQGGKVRGKPFAALCDRTYLRAGDRAEMSIELVLIDSGYQKDTVDKFCAESKHKGKLFPSKGRSYRTRDFSETTTKKGYKRMDHAIMTPAQGTYRQRAYIYDTDHWKTFLLRRLKTSPGDRGAVTVFKGSAHEHKNWARHIVDGEYFVIVEKNEKTTLEWSAPVGEANNHWWDTMVGCCVGGMILGCTLMGQPIRRKSSKRRRKVIRKKKG